MTDASGTTTYTYNAGNRLTLITDPDSTVTTWTALLSTTKVAEPKGAG